jgi:hypothetical protein
MPVKPSKMCDHFAVVVYDIAVGVVAWSCDETVVCFEEYVCSD